MKNIESKEILRNLVRPEYTRRKEAPCAICGTPTKDKGPVCKLCRYNHAAGVTYLKHQEEAHAAGETVEIRLPYRSNTWGESEIEAGLEVRKYHAADELHRAIVSLANLEGGYNNHTDDIRRVGFQVKQAKDFYESLVYRTTGETANKLDRAIALLRMALRYAEEKGRDSGESFVTRLAAGEIKYSDLNKL